MSDRDEDRVGYGRPPKCGQFQKGKSGNPKGRPRKKKKEASPIASSELDALLSEVFDQKVTVKEDGQTKEIKMIEAITRKMAADAVKGNHHAQREALRLARAVEDNEAKRAAATQQKEAEEAARGRERSPADVQLPSRPERQTDGKMDGGSRSRFGGANAALAPPRRHHSERSR